jgi:hypothetical protein
MTRTSSLTFLGRFLFLLATSLGASGLSAQEGPAARTAPRPGLEEEQRGRGLHGYISYDSTRPKDPAEFGYGMGFYTAAWTLIDSPLAQFQIGLASAWILPDNRDNRDRPLAPKGTLARDDWPERGPTWESVFQTLEGGVGYWRGNRFRYGPPKFSMNGTPQCYDYEIGSPGWSFFYDTEALRDDRLGIAQLSNRLLIPPDALPFRGRPEGKFFGYTYMALPFTAAVPGHKGRAPVGEHAWTCFLSTANFKGPIAYYIPETWSKIADLFDEPFLHGRGLDSRVGRMNGGAIEINTVPQRRGRDRQGKLYSKIPALRFPVNAAGETVLVQDVAYYSREALFESFRKWRDGGPAPSGRFNPKGRFVAELSTRTPRFDQDGDQIAGVPTVLDTAVFARSRWGLKWKRLEAGQSRATFPQYFRHEKGRRVAIDAAQVPPETGLRTANFRRAEPGEPFTSPESGAWVRPGAKSAPLVVDLGDGSRVTYRWYRFVDQPSFQQYRWSREKKAKLQSFVERIHRAWSPDRVYMAPPTRGELVALDTGLFVKPPPGMEFGYVPIVTRQEKSPSK